MAFLFEKFSSWLSIRVVTCSTCYGWVSLMSPSIDVLEELEWVIPENIHTLPWVA